MPHGSTDCRAVSHYWVQPISENECSKSDGWMNKSEEKKAVTGSATCPVAGRHLLRYQCEFTVTGSATCPDAGRHLLRYQCEFDTVSRSPKSKTSLFHSAYGLKGPTTGLRLRKSKSDKMFFGNICWVPSTMAVDSI